MNATSGDLPANYLSGDELKAFFAGMAAAMVSSDHTVIEAAELTLRNFIEGLDHFFRRGDGDALKTALEGTLKLVLGKTPVGLVAKVFEIVLAIVEKRARQIGAATKYLDGLDAYTTGCFAWSLVGQFLIDRWRETPRLEEGVEEIAGEQRLRASAMRVQDRHRRILKDMITTQGAGTE